MCLILFAYGVSRERPLVVAANRDEFYSRPSIPAGYWNDQPAIFGGRDELEHGTWLGVSRSGRFAAVTNWTSDDEPSTQTRSRGEIVSNFLASDCRVRDYETYTRQHDYRGYNMLVYDGDHLLYSTNRTNDTRILDHGIYGLTNTFLGDTWPKAERGVTELASIARHATASALIDLLFEECDEMEPIQNIQEGEQRSRQRFLRSSTYGTVSSTGVVFENGSIDFVEQSYGPHGAPTGRVAKKITIQSQMERASGSRP